MSAAGLSRAAEPARALAHEDSVGYTAEIVDYDLKENLIRLSGNATVRYRGMELAAERITYDIDRSILCAEGVADTADGQPSWRGLPLFRDADTELQGLQMSYNLDTRKGSVVEGKTTYEKGYYFGDRIRRASEEMLYVGHGTYTTCEHNHPHYFFASHRMKLLLDDKVIASPVLFYLSDIPLMWLPFYVFPIKRGRHSGMLVPRYGSNSTDGRYLDNVGYYLAPSDYWDLTLRGRIRENTGWTLQSDLRYAKRYLMRGAVGASMERALAQSSQRRRLAASFRHDQTLGPDLSLRGTGDLVSDKDFWKDNSDSPQDRMNRTLRSYLSLSKRWRTSGNSLDITFSQDENLDTSYKTQRFPRISFRKARKPIWGAPESQAFGAPVASTRSPRDTPKKWYQSVYYSFASGLDHTRQKYPTGRKQELSLNSSMDLSSTHKIGPWLTLSPSGMAREDWRRVDQADSVQYSRADALSASLSGGTTLYGLFRPEVGPLKAIRHVVKPGLSLSYGMTSRHTGGDYGFGGDRESPTVQRSLGLRCNNTLQTKTLRGKKEQKSDLANLDFSTGYDFEKQTRKLSDLRSSLRIRPVRKFSLYLQTGHTWYDDLDHFSLRSFRLTSLSTSSSLSFSGKARRSTGEPGTSPALTEAFSESAQLSELPPGAGLSLPNAERDFRRPAEPWTVRLSHRYTLTKSRDYSQKTQWLQGSVGLSPTKNWHVDYSFNYDLSPKATQRVSSQQFDIYRDLHCWEARLRWTPSGPWKGYYFVINIKELPDIKLEKREGRVQRY